MRDLINLNNRAELTRADTSNLDNMASQLKLWLDWNCADYTFAIGRQFVLNLPWVDLPYAELMTSSQRVNPIFLGKTSTFEENISLSLPLVLAGALVSQYGLIAVIWVLAGITLFATLLEYPWQRC